MKINHKNRGFTIIEIIVLICIISLVLGLTAPILRKTVERQALAAFSKQLAGDIRYVRQRNISGEIYPPVVLQLRGDRYIIKKGTVVLETKHAPQGIRFLDSFGSEIYFNELGVPLGIGATTIRLSDSYSHIYEVIITVNTGRVRTQPGTGKW
ncbi:MAG: hypothetical protein AB1420_00915 [Bacillota bacterium]